MVTQARRAATVAFASALLGLLLFEAVSFRNRDVQFEMNRLVPKPASDGFHGPETLQDDGISYQWTDRFALVRLTGLDRRVAWSCGMRVRAPRPPNSPPVSVEVTVDGAAAATMIAGEAFEHLPFTISPRASPSARIGISADPAWAPGGSDRRALGVQVDWIRCSPASRVVWPPVTKAAHASLIAALLGLAFALAGAWLVDSLIIVGVAALGLAAALTSGAAPFLKYSSTMTAVAMSIAAGLVVVVKVVDVWRRVALSRPALCAAAISAAALLLKLAGVMHPSMPMGDSLFQAHKLVDVLNGVYFFTRHVGETEFPYAIGLFVFAAPWSALTSGSPAAFVDLLRIVVVSSDVIAGALVYLIAVRAWGRPWPAVACVALFHCVPLPYTVVANGNLTNAFAQSAAFVALAAATLWTMNRHRILKVLGLTALFALAFCSHISTIVLLLATVCTVVAIGLFRAGESRAAAISIMSATVAALVFSTAVYYGHFVENYAQAFARVRAPAGASAPAPSSAAGEGISETRARANLELMSRQARASTALSQVSSGVGWPLLALMAVGVSALRVSRPHARPGALLVAWTAVWVGTFLSGVTGSVGPQYGPYAIEFLDRVNLATYPGVVLVAGSGLAAAWQSGRKWTAVVAAGRVSAIVLLAYAFWIGSEAWLSWLR